MGIRVRVLLAAGLAAATVTAGSVLPAAAAGQASAPSAASSDASSLTSLTITKVHTYPEVVSEQVTLRCEPTGGTHPTAEDACGKLLAVDGQFGELPLVPGFACPPVWRPVTVTVTGTWRLQPVSWSKRYSSECDAHVLSDNVFRF
jgi:hypothetical protein